MNIKKLAGLAIAGWALSLATGCHIDAHNDGKNQNVKIATPFGGMSVKTNANAVEDGVGLSVYPGSVRVKKDGDHDDGAADVSMSFGSFHLGVKAVSYQTSDSPESVEAFYRKDMARYGTVILCRGNSAVGEPQRTADGLTCNEDGGGHVHVHESDRKNEELKAGSRTHQHLVSIEEKGSGTEVGLIALDLPGKLTGEGEDKQ